MCSIKQGRSSCLPSARSKDGKKTAKSGKMRLKDVYVCPPSHPIACNCTNVQHVVSFFLHCYFLSTHSLSVSFALSLSLSLSSHFFILLLITVIWLAINERGCRAWKRTQPEAAERIAQKLHAPFYRLYRLTWQDEKLAVFLLTVDPLNRRDKARTWIGVQCTV